MTQLQLQSELMSFADRFATILSQALDDFKEKAPSRTAHYIVRGDTIYSISAAFTIAAQPNPEVALLDMVILTTLGRIIYEEHYLEKFGSPAEEIVQGFRKLEMDIRQIAQKVLTPQEQRELREMVRAWRQDHPEQLFFAYLRFSDFAAERTTSTLAKAVASGGIFDSVKKATKEVEETRLLAERALFLASRLPLLGGSFVDVWLSEWLTNPEVERILGNMDQVSDSAERLSKEIQKVPDRFAQERDKTIDQAMDRVAELRQSIVTEVMDRVTAEREAAINQFMDRLARERKDLLSDLTSNEEDSMRGLLVDLQKTLEQGNKLAVSVKDLTERLGTGGTDEDSEPFDIREYRATAAELSQTVEHLSTLTEALDRLLSSPGWEKSLPKIVQALDKAEREGEELVNHTFRQVLVLILVFLAGLVAALLLYRYASVHLFERRQDLGKS